MKMNTTNVGMNNVTAVSVTAKIDTLSKDVIKKSMKIKQLKSDIKAFVELWTKEVTDNLALTIELVELTKKYETLNCNYKQINK